MVDRFTKDWSRNPKTPISKRMVDTIHPVPLRQRVDETIYRLRMVQRKLEDSHLKTEQKYKKLFSKCVKAQENKDQKTAIMYANESAQVKKISQSTISARLAIEQVILRLETVKDFGDVAAEIVPAAETVRAVRGRLAGVIPEVSLQLGAISQSLDSLVLESGEVTGSSWSTLSSGEDSEKILAEASAIAEQKLREGFPDLPSTSVERGINSS